MHRIAALGDPVAHTRQQLECSAITKFGIEFSVNDVQQLAEVAPVIRQIADAIFDQRTRKSPMVKVRQGASPVSPGWTVGEILDQSVTVNGSVGIFMWSLRC